MSLLTSLDLWYAEAKRNKWYRYFAVFCRVVLAIGFLPSGLVKLEGERFTGLPANHPLGHYFDALFLTGYYYKFIGIGQLLAAVLLLIPRTTLLGAMLYFPIIVNICVLAYSVRFEGTRITSLMVLANLFLLAWDYDRLKHVLPSWRSEEDPGLDKAARFPVWFFGFVFAAAAAVIIANAFMYDIRPGNSRLECTNGCRDNRHPGACQQFCDCIYGQGNSLNACLDGYERGRGAAGAPSGKGQVRQEHPSAFVPIAAPR